LKKERYNLIIVSTISGKPQTLAVSTLGLSIRVVDRYYIGIWQENSSLASPERFYYSIKYADI
jgi:hypothetical protein